MLTDSGGIGVCYLGVTEGMGEDDKVAMAGAWPV